MRKNTHIILAVALGGTVLVSVSLLLDVHSDGNKNQYEVENSVEKSRNIDKEKLNKPIANVDSPEFREWRKQLKTAKLDRQDILDFLDSDLSDAQKNALLDDQLMKMGASLDSPELKKWQKQLTNTLYTKEVDDRLGDKIGRILGEASTPDELRALEDRYRQEASTMSRGNKIGIVMASKDAIFVGQVLDDTQEHLGVRESAIERLADLGDMQKLREVAQENSGADPVLKITSIQNLGLKANSELEISDVIALSKTQTEMDSMGRNAVDVAQTAIAESAVDGKSKLLFSEWETSVNAMQKNQPTQDQLVRTLVAGKALVHAIWTEADPNTASQLIETRLAPLVQTQLELSQRDGGNVSALQALAEFNKDFSDECAVRSADACASVDDRRNAYKEELALVVQPHLINTELEFYTRKTTEN